MTAGNTPNSSSTVRNVSNRPSAAKNASGRATRRTTEHDTSPSFHWSPASSPTIDGVAAQDDREAVDPLARPGVHLVRHRARADLAGPEALGDELVAGHQPDRRGEVGRRRDELDQRRDDVVVERARIDLADAGRAPCRSRGGAATRCSSSASRSASPPSRSSWSWRGADRTLDAAQRVARDQVVEPLAARPAARRRPWRTACRASSPGPRRCGCGRP